MTVNFARYDAKSITHYYLEFYRQGEILICSISRGMLGIPLPLP